MTQTSEYARLSSYPFSTISNEANKDLYLADLKRQVQYLMENGRYIYFPSGFASPERSRILPELYATPKESGDTRFTPGEALAIQALGQEVHYFANQVGAFVPLDHHIDKRVKEKLKLNPEEKIGLIDFANGMTMFGSKLLNVFDLREVMMFGKDKQRIPAVLLERYKAALDLNQNIIKGQVVTTIEDEAKEQVEKDIESSYHLSKVGPGDEQKELLTRLSSRQRGIEFAALIYKEVLNIAFQENISLFIQKNSLKTRLVNRFGNR